MTTFSHTGKSPIIAFVLFSLLPWTAAAQTSDSASASAQQSTGPMVVEKVKSGPIIAPDFKVTSFDHQTDTLAGFYGGWLHEEALLIGGAGYWLVDRSHGHDLAYGGLVIGWFVNRDRPVGFGVKTLIGGGTADLTNVVTVLQPPPIHGQLPSPVPTVVAYHQDFFVFEPEADVTVHLNRYLKLTGGVGYRLTGNGYYGYYGYYGGPHDDRVHGVTGSVALQIGGGGT